MEQDYNEVQNIYRTMGSMFTVFFVVVMLVVVGFYNATDIVDYVMMGGTAVFVIGTYLIVYFKNFNIGYTDSEIVYGFKKLKSIPYTSIKRAWIENIDYIGRFGGVGSRSRKNKFEAFTYFDSGDFICVETESKIFYFSIKNKAIWKEWLDKHNLNGVNSLEEK